MAWYSPTLITPRVLVESSKIACARAPGQGAGRSPAQAGWRSDPGSAPQRVPARSGKCGDARLFNHEFAERAISNLDDGRHNPSYHADDALGHADLDKGRQHNDHDSGGETEQLRKAQDPAGQARDQRERDRAPTPGRQHAARYRCPRLRSGTRTWRRTSSMTASTEPGPRPAPALSSRRCPITAGAIAFTSSGETKSRPSSTARARAARCRARAPRGEIPSETAG